MNPRRVLIALYAVLLVALGIGAGALFLDARAEYNQLKQAEAASRRRLADAEARLRAQEKILERLKSDPAYVEKVMRSRGYARPGDTIFRYRD
ncbi:MAG: septum formation initiator family protein [Opitutus sp.]|nr:septum formation initiator family protein [Opitutus sp.]